MLETNKTNALFDKIGSIEWVPTSALSPPHRLLRAYSKQLIRKFARCIETFGLLAPILISSGGEKWLAMVLGRSSP